GNFVLDKSGFMWSHLGIIARAGPEGADFLLSAPLPAYMMVYVRFWPLLHSGLSRLRSIRSAVLWQFSRWYFCCSPAVMPLFSFAVNSKKGSNHSGLGAAAPFFGFRAAGNVQLRAAIPGRAEGARPRIPSTRASRIWLPDSPQRAAPE